MEYASELIKYTLPDKESVRPVVVESAMILTCALVTPGVTFRRSVVASLDVTFGSRVIVSLDVTFGSRVIVSVITFADDTLEPCVKFCGAVTGRVAVVVSVDGHEELEH